MLDWHHAALLSDTFTCCILSEKSFLRECHFLLAVAVSALFTSCLTAVGCVGRSSRAVSLFLAVHDEGVWLAGGDEPGLRDMNHVSQHDYFLNSHEEVLCKKWDWRLRAELCLDKVNWLNYSRESLRVFPFTSISLCVLVQHLVVVGGTAVKNTETLRGGGHCLDSGDDSCISWWWLKVMWCDISIALPQLVLQLIIFMIDQSVGYFQFLKA